MPTLNPNTSHATAGAVKTVNWKVGMSTKEQSVALKTDGKKAAVLAFKWSGYHNVFQFKDKTAFLKCDFTGAKDLGDKSGVKFTTRKAGTYYFGCEVYGHCQYGQKLMVTVSGSLVPSEFCSCWVYHIPVCALVLRAPQVVNQSAPSL